MSQKHTRVNLTCFGKNNTHYRVITFHKLYKPQYFLYIMKRNIISEMEIKDDDISRMLHPSYAPQLPTGSQWEIYLRKSPIRQLKNTDYYDSTFVAHNGKALVYGVDNGNLEDILVPTLDILSRNYLDQPFSKRVLSTNSAKASPFIIAGANLIVPAILYACGSEHGLIAGETMASLFVSFKGYEILSKFLDKKDMKRLENIPRRLL